MSNIAKRRWELLGMVLRKGRCRVDDSHADVSVRRFSSFGLVKTHVVPWEDIGAEPEVDEDGVRKLHIWYKYSCDAFPDFTAFVRHLDSSFTIKDLLGFNNTGNVCVWPSEEVLLHYCLQNVHLFKGKRVCELGGGMTCLAGLVLALSGEAKEVLLTDGNEQSVNNVEVTVKHNEKQFGDTLVWTRTLLWNELKNLGNLDGHFDVIICADCLFFDEYREDLCRVLLKLLKPGGEVIILAPSRNETFYKFESLAKSSFDNVETSERYDDMVWSLHQQNKTKGTDSYDENIHYPLFMHMSKPLYS